MQEMQFQCRGAVHRSPLGDPPASHLWPELAQSQSSSENQRFARYLISFVSDIYAGAVCCAEARGHPSMLPKAHAHNLRANRAPKLASPPEKVHLRGYPSDPSRLFLHSYRRISTGRSWAAARAGSSVAPTEIAMATAAIQSPSNRLG